MGIFSIKLYTLHDLFVDELKTIYGAEQSIIDTLPQMIDAASTPDLKRDFQQHLDQKRQQLDRIEDVFDMLDIAPDSQKCPGVDGILKEGDRFMSAEGAPEVKDAGLILVAQELDHYEIACYGTLRSMAETLGYTDIAEMLQNTLSQEKMVDQLLTNVAVTEVNIGAPKT